MEKSFEEWMEFCNKHEFNEHIEDNEKRIDNLTFQILYDWEEDKNKNSPTQNVCEAPSTAVRSVKPLLSERFPSDEELLNYSSRLIKEYNSSTLKYGINKGFWEAVKYIKEYLKLS